MSFVFLLIFSADNICLRLFDLGGGFLLDGVGSKNLLQDSSAIICLDFVVVLKVSVVGEDTVVDGAAFVALDGPGVGCEDLDESGTAFVTLEGAWEVFAGFNITLLILIHNVHVIFKPII